MSDYISTDSDWNEDSLQRMYDAIEDIAINYLKLDVYPNQIEIISSEQMLDAYSSIGMPLMYNHWSFGKSFAAQMDSYRRGRMGLAYEIVINSSPCIAYCMEDNTMMMQALVMAHASFGHNAFFKNNYLFKQWTDAEAIIDYLAFAKQYIADCEERFGQEEVEQVLDACHALQNFGVFRYARSGKLSAEQERERLKARLDYEQDDLNELWNTIPNKKDKSMIVEPDPEGSLETLEENVLYFLEKNAPVMEQWKREIIRIVRKIAQYFYPQRQTQVMNEGFATFTHYTIMNKLHEDGKINEGYFLEFLRSHTGVVAQPDMAGINPYALGFAMFRDIRRICENPTEEDREWFAHQEWVGRGDWIDTIKWAAANFKDESFIEQFLSPTVMREFKMFAIDDDENDPMLEVAAIHNRRGFKRIRDILSNQYKLSDNEPNIQVYAMNKDGDRSITLRHTVHNNKPLDEHNTIQVLRHLKQLWKFDVHLESWDSVTEEVRSTYTLSDDGTSLDLAV